MTQLKAILAGLHDLDRAAADLMHYRPRQWADIVMCRMCVAWLVKRFRGDL